MIMVHKAAGRWGLIVLAVAVVGGAGAYWALRGARAQVPLLLRLADGTEVFFLSNTKVEPAPSYPQVREIRVDGEAFIRAAAGSAPLIVRSRLLLLTVTGESGLRVTAWSHETGEEADVLYGRVEATKAYRSEQHEPDTLLAGEEVMVNETIDLQEKETTDLPRLRAWSAALMSAATARPE